MKFPRTEFESPVVVVADSRCPKCGGKSERVRLGCVSCNPPRALVTRQEVEAEIMAMESRRICWECYWMWHIGVPDSGSFIDSARHRTLHHDPGDEDRS